MREIQRQLRAKRQEPVWNFTERTDRAVLADRVGRELLGDLMAMRRRRWMETQELIAKWKAAADRLKPPRSRKVREQNREFAF